MGPVVYGHPGREILRQKTPEAVLWSRTALHGLLTEMLVGLLLPLRPGAAVLHGVTLGWGRQRVEIDHLVLDSQAGVVILEVKGWAGLMTGGPEGWAGLLASGQAVRRPAVDRALALRRAVVRRLASWLFGEEIAEDRIHALVVWGGAAPLEAEALPGVVVGVPPLDVVAAGAWSPAAWWRQARRRLRAAWPTGEGQTFRAAPALLARRAARRLGLPRVTAPGTHPGLGALWGVAQRQPDLPAGTRAVAAMLLALDRFFPPTGTGETPPPFAEEVLLETQARLLDAEGDPAWAQARLWAWRWLEAHWGPPGTETETADPAPPAALQDPERWWRLLQAEDEPAVRLGLLDGGRVWGLLAQVDPARRRALGEAARAAARAADRPWTRAMQRAIALLAEGKTPPPDVRAWVGVGVALAQGRWSRAVARALQAVREPVPPVWVSPVVAARAIRAAAATRTPVWQALPAREGRLLEWAARCAGELLDAPPEATAQALVRMCLRRRDRPWGNGPAVD